MVVVGWWWVGNTNNHYHSSLSWVELNWELINSLSWVELRVDQFPEKWVGGSRRRNFWRIHQFESWPLSANRLITDDTDTWQWASWQHNHLAKDTWHKQQEHYWRLAVHSLDSNISKLITVKKFLVSSRRMNCIFFEWSLTTDYTVQAGRIQKRPTGLRWTFHTNPTVSVADY